MVKNCPYFKCKCIHAESYELFLAENSFIHVPEVQSNVVSHIMNVNNNQKCKKSCLNRDDNHGRIRDGAKKINEFIKLKLKEQSE